MYAFLTSSSDDIFSEGCKRQPHKLEMLFCERQADDGDGKQYAEKEVRNGNPEARKDDPDNIERQGQAAGDFSATPDLATEGE